MPWEYLEDEAIADIGIKAWASTLDELFEEASVSVCSLMTDLSIFEITEVLRDLCVIREDKILSFGEKKMLELGKGLLIKELAISQGTDEPTVEAKIEGMFKKKQ